MKNKDIQQTNLLSEIVTLMNIGEANMTEADIDKLRKLSLEAQAYEKSIYTIPSPSTFEGMIELRMYEMKLKQKDLAKKLNVSDTKLSLILAGKQRPDIPFIKAVHSQLNVPADFILQHI